MPYADGVLPDEVSRDPRSGAWLVFVDLAPGIDVKSWLENVATPARDALMAASPAEGDSADAVCTVGFGSALFDKAAITAARPKDLAASMPPGVPPDSHDLVFYIFARADALVAAFLRALAEAAPGQISGLSVERGYQRADKREVFGNRDGLRNGTDANRADISFVPQWSDEPPWSRGGSYMAYLKITQNVRAWNQLSADQQAAIIGRRPDGSRLDEPAGTPVEDEGEFAGDVPTPNSHVRKAGPRGAENDSVQIFRRGVPFAEVENNQVVEGLQFVSYQADLANFTTILQRWMNNANFPTTNAGVDALFQQGLASIVHGGLYFAVPPDDRYIGAGAFDNPDDVGHLLITVRVTDANGNDDPAATLAGATFTITGPGVSQTLTTNAAGRAAANSLPTGQPLTVTQKAAPDGAAIAQPPDMTVTLDRCERSVLTFINTRTTNPGGYGA